MHSQDGAAKTGVENKPAPARRTATTGGVPLNGPLALQGSIGNAAVIQRLLSEGYLPLQNQHGDGCGDQQTTPPPVRRSAVLGLLRSSGRPLDSATRTDMEGRLGADFSDVRIHDDDAAKASAVEVGARAYTSGSHVVIGEGGADGHTLAHELTHVIQQRQGPVTGTDNGAGLKVSDPTDRYEREAEANATRAMSLAPTPAAPVQRAAEDQSSRPAPAEPRAVQRTRNRQMSAGSVDPGARVSAGALGAETETVPVAESDVPGVVSLAPVVLSDGLDIAGIARKYRTGFTGTGAIGNQFALVIGVNYWEGLSGQEELLRQKINEFKATWTEGEAMFPVEVIGFNWHSGLANKSNYKEQNIIPYGSIRDRILRDEAVPRLIQGLKECGRQHVYVHTSDADTQSFVTPAGPLFSAAGSPAVAAGEQTTDRPAGPLHGGLLDLFSGGYAGPAPNATAQAPQGSAGKKTKKTKKADGYERDLMLWHAGQVDLAVRDVMAELNPRSVYYPEPNTFIKVAEYRDDLEPGISFEQGNQEGAALVKTARNEIGERDAAEGSKEVKENFDSRYAITTDMKRIGENVETDQSNKGKGTVRNPLEQLSNLAQSHAGQTTWGDRVEEAYALPAGIKGPLGELVFARVHDSKFLRTVDVSTVKKSLLAELRKNKDLLNRFPNRAVCVQVVNMAIESRKVLLTAFGRAANQLSASES
ncbi:DUF4157 domain-containing protein [Streptomyces castrisilvae]|uniref:DUF4157 domain-containing protein n=1 Tax=Streptomyces castrisilvae TaxID=3033811 RepID=A0ABY9HIT4_9ACTN|nr:DUF4157 domain-containing protein [Streptomyces sp. Mut1]WLQ34463.1 DUF4157 domain-containing protein [Streptomyces sp. Mut1]